MTRPLRRVGLTSAPRVPVVRAARGGPGRDHRGPAARRRPGSGLVDAAAVNFPDVLLVAGEYQVAVAAAVRAGKRVRRPGERGRSRASTGSPWAATVPSGSGLSGRPSRKRRSIGADGRCDRSRPGWTAGRQPRSVSRTAPRTTCSDRWRGCSRGRTGRARSRRRRRPRGGAARHGARRVGDGGRLRRRRSSPSPRHWGRRTPSTIAPGRPSRRPCATTCRTGVDVVIDPVGGDLVRTGPAIPALGRSVRDRRVRVRHRSRGSRSTWCC